MKFFLLFPVIAAAFTVVLVTGCGQVNPPNEGHTQADTPVGIPDAEGVIVRARATLEINAGEDPRSVVMANSGTQTVNVTLASSASMTMSNANFVTPTITNSVVDFGYLDITALSDNDLKVCGTNGNQRCTKALFRIYTTGTAGAGIYNASDAWGAPITASGVTSGTAGLNQAGAIVVQVLNIPSNKNRITLADFSPVPHYGIKADFTDAGAGAYTTTINVEYALAP